MKRAYVVKQADLRMDGDLAMNVKRVLPVTQADFATAVANGQAWNVMRYHVVNSLDNMRGGTMRILKVNAPAPGVQRAFLTSETTIITVLGVPPLVLPDAIEGDLVSLKAFGGTEQGLPADYTALTYVENSATTLVPLGVSFGTSNFKMEITAVVQNGSLNLFQSQTSGGLTRGIGGSSSNTIYGKAGSLNDVSITANNYRTAGHKYAISFTAESGTGTLKVDDLTASTTETVTGTYTTGVDSTEQICLFGNTQAQYVGAGTQIFSAKLWKDGVLMLDLVPSRKGATIGFFDLVSRTFKTASTGTLLAGLDTTLAPTPDAPIDIVCNNGVLKARMRSGLPLGYTKLEYIESSGTQWLDTGIYLTDEHIIDTKFTTTNANANLCGSRNPGSPSSSFGITSALDLDLYQATSEINSGGRLRYAIAGNTTYIIHMANGNKYIADENGTILDSNTYSTSSFTSTYTCPIFTIAWGQPAADWTSRARVKMYYFKISKGNNVLRDLVPAKRDSDNEIGMFDLASGVFLTNQGTGVFTSGTVDDELQVYADGTVETIKVCGKNLFDSSSDENEWVKINGSIEYPVTTKSNRISAHSGSVFTVSTSNAASSSNIIIVVFWSAGGEMLSRQAYTSETTHTVTAPAGAAQLLVSCRNWENAGNVQVENGSTATTYEPYYNGGTATAEMLLSIDEYTDQQEIIDGTITRKLGILVLDGVTDGKKLTPTWNATYKRGNIAVPGIKQTSYLIADCACTHFPYSTTVQGAPTSPGFCSRSQDNLVLFTFAGMNNITSANDANDWIAAQYNAGTPVIIVYPLETPTTETVTGQPMSTAQGDNTVEITQASIDGLELEVTYNAGVVLTVEEVEDAQLSPDVEVTIQ